MKLIHKWTRNLYTANGIYVGFVGNLLMLRVPHNFSRLLQPQYFNWGGLLPVYNSLETQI